MQIANALPAILGAFITAIAALTVAAYNVYRTWKLRRDELTLTLCSRFSSKDMLDVRAETWKTAQAWMEGNEAELISHFLRPEKEFGGPTTASSPLGKNNLDSASNLSIFLHFFAELSIYYDLGLLNKKVVRAYFGDIYEWWAPFLKKFAAQYKQRASLLRPLPVPPPWVKAITSLDKLLGKT